MKIARVLLHSGRARGAVLAFLAPAAKLALALVVSLAVYELVIFGLRWAGYDGATIDNVVLIALLVIVLCQRIKEEMDLDRVRTATDGSAHGQSS